MLKSIIKSRVAELQVDIDKVKVDLESLKSQSISTESVQKLDELTRKLLIFKAGQAELANLLQL